MYEIFKDFAGPVATFIASVTAAWVTCRFGAWQARIAQQQADLAEERVKLDKFDRRFAVFDATRELIRIVMQRSHADAQQIFDYRMKTRDAIFLFDDQISAYLEEFADKAWNIWLIEDEINATTCKAETARLLERQRTLKDWIRTQHKPLVGRFSRYLRLKA
jgi:hypothetical protein